MKEAPIILVGGITPETVETLRLALSKLENTKFHIVYDGHEVIQYLKGEGKFSDRSTYPYPSWMILNFQTPGLSALDIMRWVRSHSECAVIPIMLFSDAPTPEEVKEAYELRVNSVFKRPQTLPEMEELFATLCRYWSRAEIPQAPPGSICS